MPSCPLNFLSSSLVLTRLHQKFLVFPHCCSYKFQRVRGDHNHKSKKNPLLKNLKQNMGRSYFLRILIVSALLSLCFSHGFGRVSKSSGNGDFDVLMEDSSKEAREVMEIMDYPEPGPNPRRSPWLSPPPPATHPPPPPSQ